MIDPAERKALEDALERFDAAYVDVVQAAKRILVLLDLAKPQKPEPCVPSPPASLPTRDEARARAVASGFTGEACSRCGSFATVRNGTCLLCRECGQTSGCS